MKRLFMITVLALSAAAFIFAQGTDRWGPGSRGDGRKTSQRERSVAEKVTVTGNLTIVKGMPAIKNNDKTYLIPGLLRYVGFIDGLKTEAQVSIEGNVMPRQVDEKTTVVMPLKLTVGGKEYEMGMPFHAPAMQKKHQGPSRQQPGIRGDSRRQGPGCNCANSRGQGHKKGNRR